ncbi:MAG: hypothetical protein U0694_16585 [Anaerolineae bacterium]
MSPDRPLNGIAQRKFQRIRVFGINRQRLRQNINRLVNVVIVSGDLQANTRAPRNPRTVASDGVAPSTARVLPVSRGRTPSRDFRE